MRSKDRITIGWADPGTVEGEFAVRLMMLAQQRSSLIASFIRVEGSALVSRQRNEIVSTFLDSTDSAWLLMLDADEVLSAQAFDKLVAAAHDTERPLVAGLYFGAFDQGGLIPTPVPLIYAAMDGKYAALHDYPIDQLIEVDAAGTGCMLIHRSILEAIRATATEHEGSNWCWFNDGPINGHWFGEDLIFCRRVQAAGFPIHAHTGALLPHRKRFWLTDAHHAALRS